MTDNAIYEMGRELVYLEALMKSEPRMSEDMAIYNYGRIDYLREALYGDQE